MAKATDGALKDAATMTDADHANVGICDTTSAIWVCIEVDSGLSAACRMHVVIGDVVQPNPPIRAADRWINVG